MVIALFLAVMPFKIAGHGTGSSLQGYQDAKGSWMPAAYANANPKAFFIATGAIGLLGFSCVIGASIAERRCRKSRQTKALDS